MKQTFGFSIQYKEWDHLNDYYFTSKETKYMYSKKLKYVYLHDKKVIHFDEDCELGVDKNQQSYWHAIGMVLTITEK